MLTTVFLRSKRRFAGPHRELAIAFIVIYVNDQTAE